MAQSKNYCCFKIYHVTGWNAIRLIWIGFFKNEKNNKCLIDKLPKDIVLHVVSFLRAPVSDMYISTVACTTVGKE